MFNKPIDYLILIKRKLSKKFTSSLLFISTFCYVTKWVWFKSVNKKESFILKGGKCGLKMYLWCWDFCYKNLTTWQGLNNNSINRFCWKWCHLQSSNIFNQSTKFSLFCIYCEPLILWTTRLHSQTWIFVSLLTHKIV